jgi:hypothetical protein
MKLLRTAQANNPSLKDSDLVTPADFTRLTNFKVKKNVKLKRALWGFFTLFITVFIAASVKQSKN